ncbi:unnamed protein product [marine sediment metagenome]|uniref:Uncharacterized protein n=1 Tax=marine sediment metagenome TaxID=412755 RepID=X1UTM9_9ZZZZ
MGKDWEIRRERADKARALLDGKATDRVVRLIARAYLYGDLEKPLDELTDEELLAKPLVGPKTVEAIRAVIPSPGS